MQLLRSVGPSALLAVLISLVPQACSTERATAPRVAATLVMVRSPSQAPQNRVVFVTQPVVQLLDADGNPFPEQGRVVTASLTGGGTLSGTLTAVTSADGTAAFTDLSISGKVGPRTLTFTSPGLVPAEVVVTLRSGEPVSIRAHGGDSSTATVSTPVSPLPSVRVTDADSNGVSGIVVTFEVTSGGGSLGASTQTTDTAGVAAVGVWTLGPRVGPNTITANAAELPSVTLTVHGRAGVPSKLVFHTLPSVASRNRVALSTQPSVQLQDANGNGVEQAGVVVAASIVTGGGSLIGTTTAATTNSGVATFATLAVAGTVGARTLSFGGSGLTSVTANVTVTAGLPAKIEALTAITGAGVVGTPVGNRPAVRIRDADGNSVGGVTVTFALASGGGALDGNTAISDSVGVAVAGDWRLGATPGTNVVTATIPDLPVPSVVFSMTAAEAVFQADTTMGDSASVTTNGAGVSLPSGTSATVVSGTTASAAVLHVAEVAGANASSGNDSTRFLKMQIAGSGTDSTVLRVSVLVTDPPSAGSQQWLFVRKSTDPAGVGYWTPALAGSTAAFTTAAIVGTVSSGRAFALSTQAVTMSFLVTLDKATDYRLSLAQAAVEDPKSCEDIRRFEQYFPKHIPNPSFTVVLIHGWQPLHKCRGSLLALPLKEFDDYDPKAGGWDALAVDIRKRYPDANIHWVRYSTTGSPRAAADYIATKLAALHAQGRAGQVVLVGHSMGGLVARYVAQSTLDTRVVQLITLGTPHDGTPIAELMTIGDGDNGFSRAIKLLLPPSRGAEFLRPGVVNRDIPNPRPIRLYAIRGEVSCLQTPFDDVAVRWLINPFWMALCAAKIQSDGIVPSTSAIPNSAMDTYVARGAGDGVSHLDLQMNPQVIQKVLQWLGQLPRVARSIVFSDGPMSSKAGSPMAPVKLTVLDQYADVMGAASGTVTLSLGNAGEATLGGATSVAAVNGIASFSNLSVSRPGTAYTLTAKLDGVPEVTSGPFDVVAPDEPSIVLSTNTASFAATSGGANPPASTISLTNGGTGTLGGLVIGAVQYATNQPSDWLSASLSQTSAPAIVTLAATLGSLPAGTFTATVPIASSSSSVTNSPVSVTVTFTVTSPTLAAADLVPQTISVSPDPATVNGSVTVSYTVRNAGGTNAPASHTKVQIKTAAGALLTEQTVATPAINAGAATAETRTVSLVGASAGNHNAFVIVDNNSEVVQSDAANDLSAAVAFTVQAATASAADLVPQSISVSPNPAAVGGTVTVSYTVANQGGTNAPQSQTKIQIKSSSGVELTAPTFATNAIGAHSSVSDQRTISLAGATSGTYTVYVIVDNLSQIAQSNVTNDLSAGVTFSVQSSQTVADLVPQNIIVSPNPATAGGTVTVSYTVANQGGTNAEQSQTKIQVKNSAGTVLTAPTFTTVGIAAHSSVNESRTVSLSGAMAGTYTAYVIVDNLSQITQSSVANDLSAGVSFAVQASASPADLVPQSISVSPNPATAGGSVTVSYTIANQGGTNAPQSETKIQIKSSSGALLTAPTFTTNAISANASVNESRTVSLAGATSGTYWAYVVLDNQRQVTQSDSVNDLSVGVSFTVQGAVSAADLIPQNINVSPSVATAGGTVTVSYTVANQGGTNAGQSQTKIQIKNSSGSILTAPTFTTAAIAANSSVNESRTVSLSGATAGTYTAYVIVDNLSQITQSNAVNDLSAGVSFTVQASVSAADLVPQSISVSPNPATAGGSITVSYSVANQGGTGAPQSQTKIQIKNASGTILTAPTFTTPSISAHGSVSETRTVSLAGATSGTYTAYVIVDNLSQVTQSNVSNDLSSGYSFTVQATTATAADLLPQSISLSPNPANVGSSLTVSYTVRNQGGTSAPQSQTKIQIKTAGGSLVTQQTFSTSAVGANASVNESRSISLAGLAAGNYNVFVIVDNASQVSQSNTANDFSSGLALTIR